MSLRKVSHLLYMIKLANQKIVNHFEEKTGFSLTRYELLLILRENGVCLQTFLQEELEIDRAAVTRHLKSLEDKGYVTRQRNPDNNREILVKITQLAEEVLTSCEENHTDWQSQIDSSFSESELQQLNDLIKKLEQNL